MDSFRLASRELFNHFFRVSGDPYENNGWAPEERFSVVEATLFEQMVLVPNSLAEIAYGKPQASIRVALRVGELAPIMINRETDSGYWDHQLREFTKETQLSFVQFFDWDRLAIRSNQYVHVVITAWASHPEVIGKHALVDAQYVLFNHA